MTSESAEWQGVPLTYVIEPLASSSRRRPCMRRRRHKAKAETCRRPATRPTSPPVSADLLASFPAGASYAFVRLHLGSFDNCAIHVDFPFE